MREVWAVVALATAIVWIATTGAGSALATGTPSKSCGTISAETWHTSGTSGETWAVKVAPPTTCSTAEREGAGLTRLHVGKYGNFASSPAGFFCSGVPTGGAPVSISCSSPTGLGGFTVIATGYRGSVH